MPSLRELQLAFAAAVFEPGERSRIADAIDARGMEPGKRHGIYRNNIFHNYRAALRDVYPVVERLVGQEFFGFAADRYTPLNPSLHGNLHSFGGGFGAFLDGFVPAADLPYLGDVARLEWLVHEAFHAADGAAMALDRLAAVPPERLPLLTFTLHPACRLLESRFPVHRIWQVNQPEGEAEETIDLGAGGVRLLIRRHGHAVDLEPVEAAEFALLRAFAAGRPLRDALQAAQVEAPDFCLEAVLLRRIGDAVVVNFLDQTPRDENVKVRR